MQHFNLPQCINWTAGGWRFPLGASNAAFYLHCRGNWTPIVVSLMVGSQHLWPLLRCITNCRRSTR